MCKIIVKNEPGLCRNETKRLDEIMANHFWLNRSIEYTFLYLIYTVYCPSLRKCMHNYWCKLFELPLEFFVVEWIDLRPMGFKSMSSQKTSFKLFNFVFDTIHWTVRKTVHSLIRIRCFHKWTIGTNYTLNKLESIRTMATNNVSVTARKECCMIDEIAFYSSLVKLIITRWSNHTQHLLLPHFIFSFSYIFESCFLLFMIDGWVEFFMRCTCDFVVVDSDHECSLSIISNQSNSLELMFCFAQFCIFFQWRNSQWTLNNSSNETNRICKVC